MLIRALRVRGFAKGVLGDSRTWFTVWAVLTSAGLVRRLAGNRPKVLFTERLSPGEVVVIRHGVPADTGRDGSVSISPPTGGVDGRRSAGPAADLGR